MASVVCVLVKICVSSISLYKLDTDKLTAPFESAHQFTLVCTVSDSKTVPSGKTGNKGIGFKLAVRGDSEAGGLVAPLLCTAYFGKLAILFGCSLPQQA